MKVFEKPYDVKPFDEALFKRYQELFSMYEEPMIESSRFSEMVGGNVNVLETVDDFKRVQSLQQASSSIIWKTLEEAPGIFDTCEYILDGKYVEMFIATNNGGGEVYLVPKELADNSSNVQESIKIANEQKESYTKG